ncbi:DUF3918 family protein [Weizmannia acidilactici]|nr:DUF3918 family protein [Weizmannia acidilactici]
MMMTVLGFGAGIATASMAKRGMMNGRQMRKIARRMRKAFR